MLTLLGNLTCIKSMHLSCVTNSRFGSFVSVKFLVIDLDARKHFMDCGVLVLQSNLLMVIWRPCLIDEATSGEFVLYQQLIQTHGKCTERPDTDMNLKRETSLHSIEFDMHRYIYKLVWVS